MHLFRFIIASLLCIAVAGATNTGQTTDVTPSGSTSTEVIPWIESVTVSGSLAARDRKYLTNGERLKRPAIRKTQAIVSAEYVLPLPSAPGGKRRLMSVRPRALAAPSSVPAGSATYYLKRCNAGGDYYLAWTRVTGTVQQMTEQCAVFQAGRRGGNGIFGVWPGGLTCYADITYPPRNPVSCDASNAIIADYGL